MARFIHIEDNEDGTATYTMNLGELTGNEEVSMVIAMNFEELLDTFTPTEEQIQVATAPGVMTPIPNSIEQID